MQPIIGLGLQEGLEIHQLNLRIFICQVVPNFKRNIEKTMYYPVTNIFFLEPSSIVLGKACDSSYKSISYNSCRSKANTKYIFEEYEIIK